MIIKPINVMVDLETLSTFPTAGILSIGAVKFNQNEILDEFYVNLDIKETKSLSNFFNIDKNTLLWWKEQKPEILRQALMNSIPIKDGLMKFYNWLPKKDYTIWGNGADFDMPILKNAYLSINMDVPWKYYDQRCFRTIKETFDDPSLVPLKSPDGAHNALYDAKLQTQHLLNIIRE
jgi:hypothetical protein